MRRSIIVSSLVTLLLCSACSSGKIETAEIENTPQKSESSQSEESQETVDEKAESAEKEVIKYPTQEASLNEMASLAPSLMSTSQAKIREQLLKPFLDDELVGMRLITISALGGKFTDFQKVDGPTELAEGKLIDDNGNVLVKFTFRIVNDKTIHPLSVVYTSEADKLVESRMDEVRKWATS